MSEYLTKDEFREMIAKVTTEMESWPAWKKGDYSECPRSPAHPLPDVGEMESEFCRRLADFDDAAAVVERREWKSEGGHIGALARRTACYNAIVNHLAKDGDSFSRLRTLLALIASLKEKHAETRGLVRDLTVCLENRNKEIVNLKADLERLAGENDA